MHCLILDQVGRVGLAHVVRHEDGRGHHVVHSAVVRPSVWVVHVFRGWNFERWPPERIITNQDARHKHPSSAIFLFGVIVRVFGIESEVASTSIHCSHPIAFDKK